MYYSININQIAIARHNKKYDTNFDLVDGAILEYLQKQSTSAFAKRNYKIFNGLVFYLLFYDNIIQQLPLIKIENKESIGRRIKKLVDANVILQKIEKIPNNGTKIYFTTTDVFETFFSYDTTQKSDGDTTQKSDGDTTQKSDELIYDNNIKNKNINDKTNTASGLASFLEEFIDNELSKMDTNNQKSFKVFAITQLEAKSKKENRIFTKEECLAFCKKIFDSLNLQSNSFQNGNSSVSAKNTQTQKQYDKEFEDFYEAFEGVHPLKQPKRAEKVYPRWKNAIKTHTNAQILHSVRQYAEYLQKATWRKKKDVIAWLNGAMYEVDWENEKLQEQQKSNQITINNKNAGQQSTRQFLSDYERQGSGFDPRGDI